MRSEFISSGFLLSNLIEVFMAILGTFERRFLFSESLNYTSVLVNPDLLGLLEGHSRALRNLRTHALALVASRLREGRAHALFLQNRSEWTFTPGHHRGVLIEFDRILLVQNHQLQLSRLRAWPHLLRRGARRLLA